MHDLICVEVAYATAEEQALVSLRLPEGSTPAQAIADSGILTHFPEIDLNSNPIGVFGKVCALDYVLQNGDRVEIYRPLKNDPKTARRQRAARK